MKKEVLPARLRHVGLTLSQCEAAYYKYSGEIRAVARQETRSLNLDVAAVVERVLDSVDRVSPLREEILRRLPDYDIGELDRLRGYAFALFHAHQICERRPRPDPAARAVLATAVRARVLLLADATALTNRGLLEPEVLSHMAGLRSHQKILQDLATLTAVFRERWTQFIGKTGLQLEELQQAERVAIELREALDRGQHGSELLAERRMVRAQAFTLCTEAYDRLRGAVMYLRWRPGQCDALVPSLYAGRRNHVWAQDDGQRTQGTTWNQGPPSS